MYKNIEGFNIYYDDTMFGEETIILLHGWQANRNTFNRLISFLEEEYRIISIDLPGFGETIIERPYSVREVSNVIHELLDTLGIKNPIILGHSYGGRIAISYASMYETKKLILVDSAGLKKRLNIFLKLKVLFYKTFKRFGLKMGSSDYQNSEGILRKMLVMTVNDDLSLEMGIINAPTLMIYGENDKVTPLKEANKINKKIKNSKLIVMPDAGHFCYLDRPKYFNLILNAFLNGDTSA